MIPRHVALAITGASGAIYGVRLAKELLRNGVRLTLLVSQAGFSVLRCECGIEWAGTEQETAALMQEYFSVGPDLLAHYAVDNLMAPLASGSAAPDALVICPCSMGSLGRIAGGVSVTLIERAADVMLKERRPLIIVPRETPLHEIHLENMLKLARMRVRIIPAMPAFYHAPRAMGDLIDFVVGKVLDGLGIEHQLFRRWGAPGKGEE